MRTSEDRSSLLSFICPRMLSFGTVEGFRLSLINRNLLSEFDACENEFMKVYLRMRPLKQKVGEPELQSIIRCINEHTVSANSTDLKKSSVREGRKGTHSFTFSRVFDSDTTQSTMFSTVAVDQVRSFLEGMNGLIFAYGTTGSGKTYTMQGSPGNLGIIPRTFSLIFQSVKHALNMSLMPKDFSDVSTLNSFEIEKMQKDKSTLIKLAAMFSQEDVRFSMGVRDVDLPGQESHGPESTPFPVIANAGERKIKKFASDLKYTFWISFAEIYNELVYDLLDPVHCTAVITALQTTQVRPGPATKNPFSMTNQTSFCDFTTNRLRRKALDLRTDKNGSVYIKGLHSYPVNSAEEALRLLLVGRQCQKVAATRLNQTSSRSHTILTIKAVRVVDKENPKFARISSLTFCDLAGSERSEKAATGGQSMRMREAGNINSSLLTLGRCIECLRHNQAHPANPRPVPYRDSKLTRLFQSFFTGHGKACMVVNVSPNPELFDETLHALRFSALATRVIVQPNAIVEATIDSQNNLVGAAVKRPRELAKKPGLKASPNTDGSDIVTPPTVVSKKAFAQTRQLDSFSDTMENSSINGDSNGLLTEENDDRATLANSDLMRTPTDAGGLVLDHFTKDELIMMVQDLSERLITCKGELVEQEARLREEMYEAMNRQLVEFEQFYDEFQSVPKRDHVTESASHHLHNSGDNVRARKRFRYEESAESGSDSDDGADDAETATDTSGCDFADENSSSTIRAKTAISTQLTRLREQVNELEGELADQEALNKDLSKERDHLRMEVTRLEFSNTQLQLQCNREEKHKPKMDRHTQTDFRVSEERRSSDGESAVSTTPTSCSFDDSQIVINLPKATELKRPGPISRGKFFDLPVSPERAQRIISQVTDEVFDPTKTPATVIRVPSGQDITVPHYVNRLRDENRDLLNQLTQMRIRAQQAVQEKQKLESELSTIQHQSIFNKTNDPRVSDGLQSFLEHESQMETIEQLQQQLHQLEEQFARKQDSFVSTEMAYQETLKQNKELQQRLLSQVNDLAQAKRELKDLKEQHLIALADLRQQEQLDRKQALQTVREKLERQLNEQSCRLAELETRVPEMSSAVQTTPKSVLHTLMQTSPNPTKEDKILQASQLQASVGLQTDSLGPDLGSLEMQSTFKKPVTPYHQALDKSLSDGGSEYAGDAQHGRRNLRSKKSNRLRLRRNGSPKRIRSKKLPQIPDAVQLDKLVCVTSDSDSTAADERKSSSKENSDDDIHSCVSEPTAAPKQKRPSRTRRARSGSRPHSPNGPRLRQTRSTAASRKLPPLTEANQLLPDSFVKDELDSALDKMDADFLRQENRPQIRKASRAQMRRR